MIQMAFFFKNGHKNTNEFRIVLLNVYIIYFVDSQNNEKKRKKNEKLYEEMIVIFVARSMLISYVLVRLGRSNVFFFFCVTGNVDG